MFTGTPTPFLKLPQYNAADHPDFLTDINKAFVSIDTWASNMNQSYTQLKTRVDKLERDLAQTRIDAGLTNVNKESEVTTNGTNDTDN